MAEYSFESVLIRPEGVGTWTYLNIPRDISSTFGSKGQVKVRGTIGGCHFRSTALPMGDGRITWWSGRTSATRLRKWWEIR
jgi:hypothetical protein